MIASSAQLLGELNFADGETLMVPENPVPGAWIGGPSAVFDDGLVHLAYRMRRPIGEGRGFANVIASSGDGRTFSTRAVIRRERHDCDSLERPCLIRTPTGRWRLYISCSTPGSKHWRVDLLEADTIEDLPDARPRTVLPGDPQRTAPKDPVIRLHNGTWHLWASCHPLDDQNATDRMSTEHAISTDGVSWRWTGPALVGTPGTWDARGVRFTDVVPVSDGWLAFYDGRAEAEQNWEERTGAALAAELDGPYEKVFPEPIFVSPFGSAGLRYLASVEDPGGGGLRVYYESARPDGAHELRTQLLALRG